jgi:hypothetical protein
MNSASWKRIENEEKKKEEKGRARLQNGRDGI